MTPIEYLPKSAAMLDERDAKLAEERRAARDGRWPWYAHRLPFSGLTLAQAHRLSVSLNAVRAIARRNAA